MRLHIRVPTFGGVHCNLCGRLPKPDDRGWVSFMAQEEGCKKPLVFTYCAACLHVVLEAKPFAPRPFAPREAADP